LFAQVLHTGILSYQQHASATRRWVAAYVSLPEHPRTGVVGPRQRNVRGRVFWEGQVIWRVVQRAA
jgi:hypothetical protein